MALKVTCPKCNYTFQLEDALSDELKEQLDAEKKELRKQMEDFKTSKEAVHRFPYPFNYPGFVLTL